MIQLTGIQKSFGSQLVFSIPELELLPGIYWLKGSNGSGKSTLLKILAGLLPFKGTIRLNDAIDIRKQPVQYRQLVNHAEAEPAFPSFLSGSELTGFVSDVKQGQAADIERIRTILGIEQWINNPSGSYSSGMLKKLSLLMAFTGRADWILLDEPFTTLDQASQKALYALIIEKHRQGISFILTSHHDIETNDIPFTKVFLLKDQQLNEIVRS